jgi:hypothetical protein
MNRGWRWIYLVGFTACVILLVWPAQIRAQKKESPPTVDPLSQAGTTRQLLIKAEQHQDKQTLVTLKGIFKHSQDKEEKQTIASKVLHLGERDEEYWSYLVQYAKAAIESPIPNPLAVDEKGKGIRGQLSAEFLTWCDKNKCVPGEAVAAAFYRLPADVLFLGTAKDPRACDLFVRGLQSENYMIIHASAMSLANLQDKRAIPLLIQTTRRVPGIGEGIAETALIYFDDPEAQAEVRRLIPDEKALESARMSAKGIPIQKFIEVFALRFRDVPQ